MTLWFASGLYRESTTGISTTKTTSFLCCGWSIVVDWTTHRQPFAATGICRSKGSAASHACSDAEPVILNGRKRWHHTDRAADHCSRWPIEDGHFTRRCCSRSLRYRCFGCSRLFESFPTSSPENTEIGIRICPGSAAEKVLSLVLLDGLRPALFRARTWNCGSIAAAQLIRSMLYGIRPLDPAVFVRHCNIAVVAAGACLVQADTVFY